MWWEVDSLWISSVAFSFLLLRVIVSFASSESLYTGLFLYWLSYFNFIFSCNRLTFHPSLQNLTDCKHEYSVVIEGVSLVLVLLCLNSTAQLEASLGTFYAPTRPLLDTTILEYRDQISKYKEIFPPLAQVNDNFGLISVRLITYLRNHLL